jgi:putative transposase
MANEFWLSDPQWAVIEPLLPKNQPGARRTDDRRVISGIIHVLKVGCRWQDCPAVYGPPTTVYNRFRRWTMRGLWRRLFEALTRMEPGDVQAIDSTTAKAHRSAAGGKGGRGAGDRSLARRSHNEDPRDRRFSRTPHRARSNARPARRCSRRAGSDQLCPARPPPGRRRCLRQRRAATLARRTWNSARHPQQSDAQETASLRRGRLPPTQSHRTHVLPPQGLAPHRHPLRQARFKLRRRRRHRSRHHLVDLIESRA